MDRWQRRRFLSAGLLALAVFSWPCVSESRAAQPGASQSKLDSELEWQVGVAAVDITPDYPVRLSGFGFRRTESEGVRQKIGTKALAISARDGSPVLLLTVDNLGIPDSVTADLAARLKKQTKFDPRRLAVTFTHTHTAPMLTGVAATLYSMPIVPEQQARIDRYTRELTDKLEQVSLAALKDRRPAKLSWGIGKVELAMNRRTKEGPVDHDLPLLVVRDLSGKVRAIYISYACHCVTLSDNRISGDWAGFAQEQIEKNHPGAVALVSIGCGADSNPRSGVTGDKGDVAEAQGVEIATEVNRLLRQNLRPVTGGLDVAYERIDLMFDQHPTPVDYAEKGKTQDAPGYHARVQLARLERGEALRTKISYPVQSWAFGKSLAMVFLPGEVVVDYSLRLKRELDGRRLWINAYSNDAPCYIPSERILKEGGYEGGGAMVYYDQPTKLAAGLEQQIVDAVWRQVGTTFAAPADPQKTQGARPLSPEQSLAAIRTTAGLAVDLVVSEPLVVSPVAIDFGPDGKLWVAEMYDYPQGLDGRFQPGGRIRLLQSSRDDGRFDKATVFLDGIPFPTGVTVWRQGVLVCAAPDILYAEDNDGDGKADVVRKLFSGFGTDNYQGRVNSLEYGLDGWVYGSCGLFGGRITNDAGKPAVALGDRDFRIKPDEGIIEPASGRTQQGRVRDDWGNWFGCDNSSLLRHYPLADDDLRRNPHFAPEVTSVAVPDGPDANRLIPLQSNLQMFKLSGPTGRATAACGLGIYRDELLGSDFRGNAFTCEPVNLVVHRLQLEHKGFTFSGRRPPEEAEREFLASSDNWFRPVQARTGPDGGLWIVDMYRYVIEHPRWIPPEELAKVDVRAGHDMGRIYRVRPANREVRIWKRLDTLTTAQLVAALNVPNGWQRDMAGQLLLWRDDLGAIPYLRDMASQSRRSETRLAALCLLDGLRGLRGSGYRTVVKAMEDSSPRVRRHAVRLAAQSVNDEADTRAAILRRLDDPGPQVRLQVACTLGAWRDPRAGEALATLLVDNADDPILVAAVFSSMTTANVGGFASRVMQKDYYTKLASKRLEQVFRIVAALGDKPTLSKIIESLIVPGARAFEDWQLDALSGILEALNRRAWKLAELLDPYDHEKLLERILVLFPNVNSSAESESRRIAAINLLVRVPELRSAMLKQLPGLLTPEASPGLQKAAVLGMARLGGEQTPGALTANWRAYTPSLKAQVIDALFSREAWQVHLLDALPVADIDATRRQQLLSSRNDNIRKLAEEKFAGGPSPDRKKVLEDHRAVAALAGDRERGRAVFLKTCAVCHRLENAGHAVGPDLAAVTNKTPQYLLQEILDPNRNIDSRYVSYVAVTKEGLSHTGLLASESTASITLLGQEAKQQTIVRSEIEELQSTGVSLMPVGLEKDLSHQNLADVIAYLAASGPAPKRFAGNSPAMIKPVDGSLRLPAASAEIFGDQIVFEPEFGNIGYWHSAGDHVVWTVELESPGVYDVWFDWACDDGVAGNKYVLAAGAEELRGAVPGTGGWDRYRQAKIGSVKLPAGTLRVSLRPQGERVNGALADLRGVHLVAAGNVPQFPQAPPIAAADPLIIARQILDDAHPAAEREKLIRDNLGDAAAIVTGMTADMPADAKEEYRRIPWIWRVAIASGKTNETEPLRKLLDASLPKPSAPLRDWQAVVVGGGIINGISQQGVWPAERMQELLKGEAELTKRWQQALSQAVAMADSEKVRTGTRYDALRMVPLSGWKASGEQLAKYLKAGVDAELQMGAISGASDIDAPEVAGLLVGGYAHFTPANRSLAIDALLRTEPRSAALVEALEKGLIKPADLKQPQAKALQGLKDENLRTRAVKALK